MKEIYNKLNNHRYLNNDDLFRFIEFYSKGKANAILFELENSYAGVNIMTNDILIDKKFKYKVLRDIFNYSKEKIELIQKNEPNLIVDIYNLNSLMCILHELHHYKQLKAIKENTNLCSTKLKLVRESLNFASIKPNLYIKYHDFYYFEYDADMTSLIKILNIINKCKNLNTNSIIEFNRRISNILLHSYGDKYSFRKEPKLYNLFSSPISYLNFFSTILNKTKDKRDLRACIKKLVNESQTEYSKLVNGCKLSNETMKLLRDISTGIHDTVNILDDIKEINKNNEKHAFIKKY